MTVPDSSRAPLSLSPLQANRPIAEASVRPAAAAEAANGVNKRGQPRGEWDVSMMAAKLKPAPGEDGASKAVTRAAPVRYRDAGAGAQAGPSAAAIAMLGECGKKRSWWT